MVNLMDSIFRPHQFELYTGPMFGYKSDAMAGRIERMSHIEDIEYAIIRPFRDTRPEEIRASAFKQRGLKETYVDEKNPKDILNLLNGEKVVGIDEVMFFQKDILYVIESLMGRGINVLATGLDKDFRGDSFGYLERKNNELNLVNMGDLLVLADFAPKGNTICMYNGCTKVSSRTQRLRDGNPASYYEPLVLPHGEEEGVTYESRCFVHHEVPEKPH